MAWAATAIAGGAVLGGLAGSLKKRPAGIGTLERVNQRKQFKSGIGTSTPTGFTYKPLQGQQQAVGTSANQLNQLLSGGLAIDPNRQANYQQAFLNSRLPFLQQQQAQQRSRQSASNAASGASGGIGAIYGNQALGQNQQLALNQLQNQSVLGGEALANQALQQDVQRAGIYNKQLQQFLNNQLNAQATNQNAFNAQAGLDINFANQHNGAKTAEFQGNKAHNNFSRFGNIASGAIGGGIAGMNAASTFGLGMPGGGGLASDPLALTPTSRYF